jgi:hypothetical protein
MPNTWYLNFRPAKSDGTLPNKKSAGSFRYKRAVRWDIDLSGFGLGSQFAEGHWTITITNNDGSQLFFRQTAGAKLWIVNLGAAGLQFFTWSYYSESFDTTLVGGVTTNKENIGLFLDGNDVTDIEQGIATPASGYGDTFGATVSIFFEWLSPIYVFRSPAQSLPVGYKVTITRDTWNLGPQSVEYGWAFDDAGPLGLGTTFDGLGALLTARPAPDGERVLTARAWPSNYNLLEQGGAFKGNSPTYHELKDGRELVVVQESVGVTEYVSHNSEWNWNRMVYPNADGTQSQREIFDSDFTMPASLLLDDDSRLIISTKNNALYSRLVTDEGPGELIQIATAQTAGYSLEQAEDGSFLIISSETGKPVFRTRSIPPRWEPIAEGTVV